MSDTAPPAATGLLLVNLGTPDSPSSADVRRYLSEFLSDPLVLDLPSPLRWLLLHGVILRTRPARSARAYAKIWTAQGSPLRVHGRALRERMARRLALRCGRDIPVALGMRYGNPSLTQAVAELRSQGARRAFVLPLFPQWSRAATQSAERAALAACLAGGLGDAELAEPFYDHPRFIAALAAMAKPRIAAFQPDHLLFSYHGLPERQLRAVDPQHCLKRPDCCLNPGDALRRCYRAQCFATSRALVSALALAEHHSSTSFQSRLGNGAWIQPYTDAELPRLRERGVRRLAVCCPAFTADCLETLEEIGLRARERWRELGGDALELLPSLNAEPVWVEALAEIAAPHL